MKAAVAKIKDLAAVLKDLEPYVKDPGFLYKGRAFRNFRLLPREVLANWLLCAVANYEDVDRPWTFATDPMGGDGVIVNARADGVIFTEHVLIPKMANTSTKTVEDLMAEGVQHKEKKGKAYASGKLLVVFSEASGEWKPTRIARRIAGTHHFDAVWVLHIDRGGDEGYTYSVALLDLEFGQAPIWKVHIAGDFKSWHVQRIQ